VDLLDDIYIADSNNQKIRKVLGLGGPIITLAGNGTVGYSCKNGVATSVGLHTPTGVALDELGNLLIADSGNQCIRSVSKTGGLIATIAGNGLASYSGDGGPPTSAALNYPTGVALDTFGNFYIADDVNHRIRMANFFGSPITTLAGNGTPGYSGDGGLATFAQLYNPTGVGVDESPGPFVEGP
jgi:internalin A